MDIPPDILKIIEDVAGIVGEVALVGGSVRDVVLGHTPKDFDFTTPLHPDEVAVRIRTHGRRAYEIGKRFGTIGFKLDGHYIEVTTYRTEQYKSGSRKPEVSFTSSLDEDLARRDFTFNAMTMGRDGVVHDPYYGQVDLANGVIRTVGKARDRYREDPLRMLRMIRFISSYGFQCEALTAKAAYQQSHHLLDISRERVAVELDKIMVGDYVELALRQLTESRLLHFALPLLSVQLNYDQNSKYHSLSLWEHTIKTVAGVPPDETLRWAALLHDIGKPAVREDKPGRSIFVHHDQIGAELVSLVGHHLKWSKAKTQAIRQLVLTHLDDTNPLRQADNAAK